MAKCKTYVDLLLKQESGETGLGNVIHRMFMPDERYSIDFADDFKSEGWEQFDTDQDAHYFGVWVNRSKRMTMTYAEGDWSLVVCQDDAHYNAEIGNMISFYGEGFEFKTLDTDSGQITEYRQERSRFLIAAE